MAVIHISEEEAARDLHELIEKVRAGDRVEIKSASDLYEIVPLRLPINWTISDAIRQSEARGSHVLLDDEFGNDMEEIMRLNRLPRESEPWE